MMFNRSMHLAVALVSSSLMASFAGAIPSIYPIGTLGGTNSQSYGINSSGQVVGQSTLTTGSNVAHAFMFTGTPGAGGTMTDLGGLGSSSYAYAVSSSGLVTGKAYLPGTSITSRVFLYKGTPGNGGTMLDLGTLGGTNGEGRSVNDSGQVTGFSFITGASQYHAFLYSGTPGAGGAMADLGTLGGTGSYGYALNASGQVTGQASTPGNAGSHAFLYTGTPGAGGAMADLGTLGGATSSVGYAINASGQVTGVSNGHAFLYSGTPGNGGAMVDIGSFGNLGSGAYAINDAGQVVGYSARGNEANFPRAFLYQNGGMIDLDRWLDINNPAEGANWYLQFPRSISNNGLITGQGNYQGATRPFVLDVSNLGPGGGTWLNAGTSNNTWSAGPNWSSAIQPGSADSVTFATNSAYTVNFTSPAVANDVAVNSGSVTFALGTKTLTASGNVSVASAAGQSAVVNITGAGGKVSVGQGLFVGGTDTASGGIATLTVANGASVSVAGLTKVYGGSVVNLTGGTLKTQYLSVDGTSANPTGKIDLSIGSALIVDYAGASPASDIKQLAKAGRGTFSTAGGNYDLDGQGITSSAAGIANVSAGFAKYVIGVIDNADLIAFNTTGYSTFGGLGVDADSVLARATYSGDANLDGRIDAADYSLLNRGFAGTIPNVGWLSGDFTFDGLINADDYAVIDFGYLSQGTAPSGDAPVAVPEPFSALIPTVSSAILLRRRRNG